MSASPEILKVLNAFLVEKSRTNTTGSWSMELANGLKIQGGPITTPVSVITFIVPFSNPASISLAFSQTRSESAYIGRIALERKPTTTHVAIRTDPDMTSVYASWLAIGF